MKENASRVSKIEIEASIKHEVSIRRSFSEIFARRELELDSFRAPIKRMSKMSLENVEVQGKNSASTKRKEQRKRKNEILDICQKST